MRAHLASARNKPHALAQNVACGMSGVHATAFVLGAARRRFAQEPSASPTVTPVHGLLSPAAG